MKLKPEYFKKYYQMVTRRYEQKQTRIELCKYREEHSAVYQNGIFFCGNCGEKQ